MKLRVSKFLLLLLTVLIIGSCEQSVNMPCQAIVAKHKIPIGYLYKDELESKFIVEKELHFLILSNNDTVMVNRYKFEEKEVGDCFR